MVPIWFVAAGYAELMFYRVIRQLCFLDRVVEIIK